VTNTDSMYAANDKDYCIFMKEDGDYFGNQTYASSVIVVAMISTMTCPCVPVNKSLGRHVR